MAPAMNVVFYFALSICLQRELEREKQRERQKKDRAKLVAQKRNIDLGVVKNLEMMVASAEQKEKEFSEVRAWMLLPACSH